MALVKPTSSGTTQKESATTDTNDLIKIRSALAWRPSAGDMLEGTVVKLIARESEYGIYPVIVMDTGDVMYTAVHAFHTILRDAFRELKTKSGDQLVVVYQGKIESKNSAGKDADGTERKRSYHSYIVIGNGIDSTVEFDWANEDVEDGPDF
jgi:hypothetical protein